MSNVKPNTYRIYLNEENTALMRKICESTELEQTDLLSKLVSAGLRSVEQNNCVIHLPIKFQVIEPSTKPKK